MFGLAPIYVNIETSGGNWHHAWEWHGNSCRVCKKKYFLNPFSAFRALLDNYELECGEAEVVTWEEKKENRDFIDSIMETDVMKEAHSYLVEKGLAPAAVNDFKCKLYNLWFRLIRRTKGDRYIYCLLKQLRVGLSNGFSESILIKIGFHIVWFKRQITSSSTWYGCRTKTMSHAQLCMSKSHNKALFHKHVPE